MEIIARSPKTRIFWKSAKGGPREIFQKSPKKKPLLERPNSTLAQMSLSSNLYPLIGQRLEKKKKKKTGSKSARMARLWQFLQGHPKPAFSEKVQRGDVEKFFKNRPKSSPRLKGLKALWCKRHYPLISIPLKRQDWRRFWRRTQLQKCQNSRVMANFARSP